MINKSLVTIFAILIAIGIYLFKTTSSEETRSHWAQSSQTFEQVEVNNKGMPPSIAGTVDGDTALQNDKGQGLFYSCTSEHCEVTYPFKSPHVIKKIAIYLAGYFPYNKENILFKFDDYIIPQNKILRSCNIESLTCNYYFDNAKSSSTVAVIMLHAKPKYFGIIEIQFYKSRNNTIISSLYNFIFIWPRSIFSYFLHPILFFILLLSSGLIIAEVFQKKYKLNFIEIIFTSVCILSVLSLVNLILPEFLIKILVVTTLSSLFYILLKPESYIRNLLHQEKIILIIYIASIVFVSGIMHIRDFPKVQFTPILVNDFYAKDSLLPKTISYLTYETDYLIPYQTALNLKRGGEALQEKIGIIYNFTDRTPLISSLLLLFTKAFGQNMFVYQTLTVMMANLFIFSAYYLSKIFVNEIKSVAISMILAFSHFFTFITLYWPQKTIALFFIFSSLYYIVRKKPDYLSAGIHMLIAYLLHMYVLVYYLPFSLFILAKKYFESNSVMASLKSFFIYLFPTIIGFFIWTTYSFSLGQNQSIIWSIITQKTWSQASQSIDKSSSVNSSGVKSLILTKHFWEDKLLNTIDLFIYINHKNRPTRLFDFYKLTFPGSLGLVATTILLIGVLKVIFFQTKKLAKYFIFLLYFIILPTLITIALHGFYIRTGVMSYLLATIPIMLLFIACVYNTKYFLIFAVLSIAENLYLYFIQDDLAKLRLSYFIPQVNSFFLILLLSVVFLSLLIFFISYRSLSKTSRSYID